MNKENHQERISPLLQRGEPCWSYQTLSRIILADLYTPVGVYMCLRDVYPRSALMECSDYHDANDSRSFIGVNPMASVAISHGESICTFPDGSKVVSRLDKKTTVAQVFRDFIKHFKVGGVNSSFCGLYGYTSFNAVRYFEDIPVKDERQERNDAPDLYYIFYRDVIVFDHFNSKMTLITLVDDDEAMGNVHLEELQRQIQKGAPHQYAFHPVGEVMSTLTDEEHRENIRRGIRHCLRGDVFQIVLSRRFIQHYEGDDFKLYRALRSINPSPYLFYFDFGGFRIFGSSPETHCRMEKEKDAGGETFIRAYIDPIAGTTKRTGDADSDRMMAEQLRKDPKENAEHVMLVDLARNDLARICQSGTRYVKDLLKVDRYSHVMHLVSRVVGQLRPDLDALHAYQACMNMGTLTGAPKIRAMELVRKAEKKRRFLFSVSESESCNFL